MSYCLNPACSNPNNPPNLGTCQACGSTLLLKERYRATRILGRGGFATTFLSTDEGLPGQPICVIKQLRPVLSAEHILQMSQELFHREATTLGKIGNHPQLPRLLDYFELGPEFYLIQEYISGSTLQQEVKRTGPFDERMTLEVLKEVLPLLDYLHAQQVIHRDIKPANIIRRSIDKKLVLIDFGAVKDQVNQAAANNPQEHTTLTSFAVGTPGFAPPEQMAMRPVYASDLYSLGITCLYLLTGKSPKDMNYNQVTGELNWKSQVKVSPKFQQILEKLLEVSLRDRYQMAQEAMKDLDAFLQTPTRESPTPGSSTMGLGISKVVPRTPSRGTASQAEAVRAAGYRSRVQDPLSASYSKISARRPTATGRSTTQPARADHSSATIGGSQSAPAKLNPVSLQKAYDRGRRDFSGCDLNNLPLPRFKLPSISLNEAQLQNADLRGADLYKANLGKANLAGTNLRNANLQEAYLSYADLEGSDLRGADLSNAYLSNANLRGANLCGANLLGATLTMAQLSLAHVNWTTVLPNGKRGKGLW
jgi:serine/threonine protein kinase, bacterial